MGDIVNLRQMRKRKQRDEKARKAEQNRALHGQTREKRILTEAERRLAEKQLEAHRRSDRNPDAAMAPDSAPKAAPATAPDSKPDTDPESGRSSVATVPVVAGAGPDRQGDVGVSGADEDTLADQKALKDAAKAAQKRKDRTDKTGAKRAGKTAAGKAANIPGNVVSIFSPKHPLR